MTAAPTAAGQAVFAQALLDPRLAVPPGLQAWNGSDVRARYAVYRNNVMVSLTGVLADTFPVLRQTLGDEGFAALARAFIRACPPTSPVMTAYGEAFAGWLQHAEVLPAWPWLPDLARLEWARVRAWHAADAEPCPAEALARALDQPAGLPALRLHLHPSLSVVRSAHAVVSWWAAHAAPAPPDDGAVACRPEAAVVLREGDDALVCPVSWPDAGFLAQLLAGATLGQAVAAEPQADLAASLALLIRHQALTALIPSGEPT